MKIVRSVTCGLQESEAEQGDYYALSSISVWVECVIDARGASNRQVGARWTIDRWVSHQDTAAALVRSLSPNEEVWRIEIHDVAATGWRDGSIGGPNGEQPSNTVWCLWGKNKKQVRCLPAGTPVPEFEFACFVKDQQHTHWENNGGRNFTLKLSTSLNRVAN